MVEKQLTEVEKQIAQKEILIKGSDILNFNPLESPRPVGTIVWDDNNPPSKEYVDMMQSLIIIAKYVGKQISEGPENKESMTKRCATLSVFLNELIASVSIDGWHLYGLTSELNLNTYMIIGGKQRTMELLQSINRLNQELAKKKAESYVQ